MVKGEEAYCVYLTVYRGNKLPPFYIGSTSVKNLESGYKGSVTSRKFGEVWKKETRDNPQLFSVKIVKKFSDRKVALDWEKKAHVRLSVIKNPLYINLWTAGGIFGYSVKGKDHPFYGKKLWTDKNPNPFKGRQHTSTTKKIISDKAKQRKASDETRKKMSKFQSSRVRERCSEDKKRKIGDANRRFYWITNGVETSRHDKSLPIPEGFVRGRKLKIKKKKRSWEN